MVVTDSSFGCDRISHSYFTVHYFHMMKVRIPKSVLTMPNLMTFNVSPFFILACCVLLLLDALKLAMAFHLYVQFVIIFNVI